MIIRKRFLDKWDTVHTERRPQYLDTVSIDKLVSKFERDGYVYSVMRYINPKTIGYAYDSIPPIISEKTKPAGSEIYITPGIDGVTKIGYDLRRRCNLEELYARMKSNQYHMKPGLRIYIKKPNGKLRPITILCFEDNLVQKVIVDNILNPIYEKIFLNCSYGYRPNRNCRKATNKLIKIVNKYDIRYIVEADIKSFFDNVNQDKLIDMIKITIKDKRFTGMLKEMLRAGYIERLDKSRTIIETSKGIFQGGKVSPILANVYLHYVLDSWITTINTNESVNLIRYADDFIVLTRSREDAELVLKEVTTRFKEYDLELAPDKTGIVDINESSIKFLGYEIYRDINSNRIIKGISKDRMDKKRTKLREEFSKSLKDFSPEDIIGSEYLYYKDYVAWTNNSLVGIYRYFEDTDKGEMILKELYDNVRDDINNFFERDDLPVSVDRGEVYDYLNNVYDPINYKERIKDNRKNR